MLRQPDGQLLLWYGNHTVVWAVNNRYRRAPVALPTNQPVTQAIGHHKLADALFLDVLRHLSNSFISWRTIEWTRVNHHAQVFFCLWPGCWIAGCLILGANDSANGVFKFWPEPKAWLAMRRSTTDSTAAI